MLLSSSNGHVLAALLSRHEVSLEGENTQYFKFDQTKMDVLWLRISFLHSCSGLFRWRGLELYSAFTLPLYMQSMLSGVTAYNIHRHTLVLLQPMNVVIRIPTPT